MAFESDWTTGSTVTVVQKGMRIAHPDQVVLAAEPYRRLSYTWQTFTPEWAQANGVSDDFLARISAEGRSKVTFEIEPLGEIVKLTVVHDGFEPGSTVIGMVREG
jgi:hypothetical protein